MAQNNKTTAPADNNRSVHIFFVLLVAMCLSFGLWAIIGKLDIVSTTSGRVVPTSRVKQIQHLEGGIVSEIKVREGEPVNKGQVLAVLEQIANSADVDELGARIIALRFDVIRLEGENTASETLTFPDDLAANFPDLAHQSLRLFQARQNQYQSEVATQHQKIRQKEQDIDLIQARLANEKASLALLQKQLNISEDLLAENLTTRYKHLALKREATDLKSTIEQDEVAVKRAESAVKEANRNFEEMQNGFLALVRTELKDARRQLDEFSMRIRKYDDSFQRKVIRSPVDGIIKSLYIVTKGGVVSPGMTLMDIVPASDKLVIEAHLPISDIGFVSPGQKAVLQLASSDSRRFGKLEGKVTHVSPDAFTSEEGQMYYTVRISPDQNQFEHKNRVYNLYPGVMVQAFIHIGQRSVLEYLLDPFLSTLGNSLQER